MESDTRKALGTVSTTAFTIDLFSNKQPSKHFFISLPMCFCAFTQYKELYLY